MVWVRFTADMDWKPKASVTLAYLSGDTANVTRGCAAAALSAGRAVKVRKGGRDSAVVETAEVEAGHDQ